MSADSHIIVLPGGGYSMLADHEGAPVVRWLGDLGIEASEHRYPVQTMHPGPIQSLRQRVRELKREGAERVGVLGFSAGAHLAGHAAFEPGETITDRIDLAILCYPVVSMELDTHRGSREQLLGTEASADQRRALSLDRLVSRDSPPAFIWHTADDQHVPVQHSYLLGAALANVGVPHALHVFPHGRHGLGLATGQPETRDWTMLCASWLASRGWGAAGRAA